MQATNLKTTPLVTKLLKDVPCETPYIVIDIDENTTDYDFPEPVGDCYSVEKYINGQKVFYTYLPIFGGFDIETTNLIDDNKRAYMYHAQMSVFSWERGVVYMARTWEAVKKLFEAFQRFYKLTDTCRVVQWIANAGFEFQYMRRRFSWSESDGDFFAKEKRQPLLFTLADGLEFRECLSISGGSLAQLCKDFTTTQKAAGDLDYKILRSTSTPLNDTERGYCINDVVPLAEWGAYVFETWVKPYGSIPMTKTGLLRSEVKRRCKELTKGRAKEWKQLLLSAQPPLSTYQKWREYLFRGGYVHGNAYYTGKTWPDVDMYDITSSYPARMNLSRFPGKFKPLLKPITEALLDRMANDESKAFYVLVKFYGVKSVYAHSIESTSKCINLSGAVIDNGRVHECDFMEVMLTDCDWLIYRRFYTWERSEIECGEWSNTMKLPPYLLGPINEAYKEKSELKAEGLNDTPEYAIKKSTVNAGFGLTVTRIVTDSWLYTDDWKKIDDAKTYEEEVKRLVLLPQWGIWISATARWSLLSVVADIEEACGNPHGVVIYNDTDSIKCLHDDRIRPIIDAYNARIAEQLKEAGLTDPAFHDLGMYDFEGVAQKFRELGAKRYLAEVYDKKAGDWVTKATVAGLPKMVVKELYKKNIDPWEAFSIEGLELDTDTSLKKTHAWRDERTVDYINGERMEELSSVAIYEIPFNLALSDDYYRYLGTITLSEMEVTCL